MALTIDLTERHAFVAGVGGGIGGACVRALAAAGARVSCFDIDANVARAGLSPSASEPVHSLATRRTARRSRRRSHAPRPRSDRSTSQST